jgi:putative ABC transport system permease protein
VTPETASDYRTGKSYAFAEGRCFGEHKFEAIIGSEVAARHVLKLGQPFHATHGFVTPTDSEPDVHPEMWTIVGVLAPTHTAADRTIYIPLESFYAIQEHEEGLEHIAAIQGAEQGATTPAALPPAAPEEPAYTLDANGNIKLKVPKEDWQLSAIMVHCKTGLTSLTLVDQINKGTLASAVNPAAVMAGFFHNFLDRFVRLLLLISVLVSIVATIGILVSIYNAIAARRREIAILRSLGATRRHIVLLVSLEAGLIGLLGGLAGLILGHALAAGSSVYLEAWLGQGLPWWSVQLSEWLYVGGATVLALAAGLAPALLAYRTPVAANLSE